MPLKDKTKTTGFYKMSIILKWKIYLSQMKNIKLKISLPKKKNHFHT